MLLIRPSVLTWWGCVLETAIFPSTDTSVGMAATPCSPWHPFMLCSLGKSCHGRTLSSGLSGWLSQPYILTRVQPARYHEVNGSHRGGGKWDTFMCWFHGCYHGRYTVIPHVNTTNETLSCVDFMDVIMGDNIHVQGSTRKVLTNSYRMRAL